MSHTNEKLLYCNWKSNPVTQEEASWLASETAALVAEGVRVAIFPPDIFMQSVRAAIAGSAVQLGAQDIMPDLPAVVTGEISGDMLRGQGVSRVIVGHSERRRVLQESDALINEKMRAARAAGITPILCVGEEERMDPRRALAACLDQASLAIEGIASGELEIAYEPVWAIGGDKDIEPAAAAEVIRGIKEYMGSAGFSDSARVVYGGSVNCKNSGSLLSFPEIDGFLVGSASLDPKAISCIINNITYERKKSIT